MMGGFASFRQIAEHCGTKGGLSQRPGDRGNLQVNNVNGGGTVVSAACEHVRHKEPNTHGAVLCSALAIKKASCIARTWGRRTL